MNPYAKTTTLKPVRDKKAYSADLAKAIAEHWYRTIYAPILAMIQPGKQNANPSLLAAELLNGNLQYWNGYVVGKLNAKTSLILRSLGGTFDKAKKGYKIPLSALPMDSRGAIAQAATKQANLKEKIEKHLDSTEIGTAFDFRGHFAKVIGDLNTQFEDTVSQKMTVNEQFDDSMQKRLADEYGENLNLYINGWTEQAILRLREKVAVNTFQGYRASALVDMIESENDVSRRKAKFLARQETSLLVSKYRQERYEDIGVIFYKWSTSHDERVRDNPKGGDHKILEGHVFRFDDPPIVDRKTGRRANPGEDFNCRCVAIPILQEDMKK